MSRMVCAMLAGCCVGLVMLTAGCSPQTDLSLQFSPDQTTQYKSVTDVVKDFRFEQPNLDKMRAEQTRTTVEMTFTQDIQSIDDAGNAVAQITIDGLKVIIINKNEKRFSFDSANEADKDNPLAKLLGRSYTIQISPDGKVSLLDSTKAVALVPSGYEKRVAESILNEENVKLRHEILALPEATASQLSVGSTWTTTVPSPPGLLAPKTFEKVYTLTDIDGTVATVKMLASEAPEQAEGATSTGGMGMFARMFDNEDNYSGTMQLDVQTGTVLSAEEKLVSTYLAQEMPEKGDPEKGPDTLTMQFTHHTKLEKLN